MYYREDRNDEGTVCLFWFHMESNGLFLTSYNSDLKGQNCKKLYMSSRPPNIKVFLAYCALRLLKVGLWCWKRKSWRPLFSLPPPGGWWLNGHQNWVGLLGRKKMGPAAWKWLASWLNLLCLGSFLHSELSSFPRMTITVGRQTRNHRICNQLLRYMFRPCYRQFFTYNRWCHVTDCDVFS